jgi:hypothetical protein
MHMTKLNKRILAAAIAGAIVLPGVASAADLVFGSSQQITFARDLIVNNGTTILTPNDLDLRAQAIDAANIATVTGGETVRFKVTLTNGAIFDSTADVTTLVQGFVVGSEFLNGAAPVAVGVNGGGGPEIVGTPFYSASGQELNFVLQMPGAALAPAGTDLANPAYAIKLNSFQITNLKNASDAGQSIAAEITAQNSDGQQILAARQTIANFEWGINSTDQASTGFTPYRIDVTGCPNNSPAISNRTRFSPSGAVGNSCVAGAPANELYNVGGLRLNITRATETDGATNSFINNFSAIAATPDFNVVNTATWTFTVTAGNAGLNAFTGGDLFLSDQNSCVGGASASFGTITAGATTATVTVPAGSALVANLSNSTPSQEDVYVCFRADDASTITPISALSVAWSIDYNLPTQRVNPPGRSHNLLPLLLNGTTITFQNVNPAGNTRAESFIRLTNHNGFACPITLDAKDDAGVYTMDSSRTIRYTIPAQASWTINSPSLENGATGATGSFGDGAGRWYVRVTAECANVVGSALNRNLDTGVVTNLTTERNNDQNLFGR